MSVLIQTTRGDIVVDLLLKEAPIACKNFLKLCKIKAYNNCIFFNVQKNFIIQTGDPTNTGKGGESIYGKLFGDQAKYFEDEIHPRLKPKLGSVCMANMGPNMNTSQFFIVLRNDDLDMLEGKHTVFGEVAEGMEVATNIGDAFTDTDGRPFQNIRIRHTVILDDPFPDPPGLVVPPTSPPPVKDSHGLEDDEPLEGTDNLPPEEQERLLKEKEAKSRAVVLEMIGDLPDADVAPPDNVLFVCKLNPVTDDESLHLIFSRFGKIKKAEVIRDHKTNESLCYAFIEFEDPKSCEEAYFKMDNVVIDDRRIHVDFSQSVSRLHSAWRSGKPGRLLVRPGGRGAHKTVTPSQNPHRGGGPEFDMVFDEEELAAAHQPHQPHASQSRGPHAAGRGADRARDERGRGREPDRREPVRRERERERDYERERPRHDPRDDRRDDRARDTRRRSRSRSRSRSPRRERRRSRSRSRSRSRDRGRR